MKTYEILGNSIRKQRKKKGLTQEKLSELCGFDYNYIGYIERAKKRIGIDLMVRIANTLEVSADYLLSESITFSNDAHIDKARAYLSDMDRDEIKMTCDLIKTVRKHSNKKDRD